MTTDLATSTTSDTSEDSHGLGASVMTPREITSELDKHIVGQASAKRAVAIALPVFNTASLYRTGRGVTLDSTAVV